jgi:hypothetical protein
MWGRAAASAALREDQLREQNARESRATNVVTVFVAMVSSSGSALSAGRLDSLRAYSRRVIRRKGQALSRSRPPPLHDAEPLLSAETPHRRRDW